MVRLVSPLDPERLGVTCLQYVTPARYPASGLRACAFHPGHHHNLGPKTGILGDLRGISPCFVVIVKVLVVKVHGQACQFFFFIIRVEAM